MSPDNHPGGPLRSQLAGDPDMAELVELFVTELPNRLDAINAAWSGRKVEDLTRIAHQLRGASASYGFPTIGAAAGHLEDQIRSLAGSAQPDLDRIKSGVDELVSLCRRASN